VDGIKGLVIAFFIVLRLDKNFRSAPCVWGYYTASRSTAASIFVAYNEHHFKCNDRAVFFQHNSGFFICIFYRNIWIEKVMISQLLSQWASWL